MEVAGHLAPAAIQAFKSATAKRIYNLRRTPGAPVWQRNYYERIIRSEEELNAIRQYIIDNPVKWAEDRNNPGLYRRTVHVSREAPRLRLR